MERHFEVLVDVFDEQILSLFVVRYLIAETFEFQPVGDAQADAGDAEEGARRSKDGPLLSLVLAHLLSEIKKTLSLVLDFLFDVVLHLHELTSEFWVWEIVDGSNQFVLDHVHDRRDLERLPEEMDEGVRRRACHSAYDSRPRMLGWDLVQKGGDGDDEDDNLHLLLLFFGIVLSPSFQMYEMSDWPARFSSVLEL